MTTETTRERTGDEPDDWAEFATGPQAGKEKRKPPPAPPPDSKPSHPRDFPVVDDRLNPTIDPDEDVDPRDETRRL